MKWLQKISVIFIFLSILAFIPLSIEIFGNMNVVIIKWTGIILIISLVLGVFSNLIYKIKMRKN